jgi:hypothetical protein
MRSKIRTLAWRSRASRFLAHDLVGSAVNIQFMVKASKKYAAIAAAAALV